LMQVEVIASQSSVVFLRHTVLIVHKTSVPIIPRASGSQPFFKPQNFSQNLFTQQYTIYSARAARMPRGLCVLLVVISFLFSINLTAKRAQDLLDRFSPPNSHHMVGGRYLIVDYRLSI